MAEHLQVELVAADRTVWSGRASMIITRTTEGDLGILRGHAPMLAMLDDAVVEITDDEGGVTVAVVDGGFLSVAADHVSVLSERAVLAAEVDVDDARTELEAARGAGTDGLDDSERRIRRAEARLRAVEKAS